MFRKFFSGALCGAFVVSVSLAGSSGSEGRWLHVKVDDTNGDGETVRVNLPLGLVENVLPFIQFDELRNGKLHLDDWMPTEIDIRGVLEAIRDTEDAEFVTVESAGETVRVAKSKGFLLVHVEDDDGEETVDIKLPLKVVDALLSAGQNELDIAAAIQILGESADGDLVTVRDRSSTIRVWIDSSDTIE